MAVALVIIRGRSHAPDPSAPMLAGFTLVSASPDLQISAAAAGRLEIRGGHCTLGDGGSGTTVNLDGASAVERTGRGLRILRGRVALQVRRRSPGEPAARFDVSHGSIEVLGTRFTIIQRGDGGEVRLHEGAIRFLPGGGGTPVLLAPGQSLRWPVPMPAPVAVPAPVATTDDASPVPPPAPRPAVTSSRTAPRSGAAAGSRQLPEPVEGVVTRVAELRSRGRFEDAARVLSEALRANPDRDAAERLSFELGAIVTHQIGDRSRACAHWAGHARRFGHGRYGREIALARASARCSDRRR